MPVHSHIHTQGPLSQLHLGPLGLLDERAYTCEAKCGSVIKTKHTEVRVFCEYTHTGYLVQFNHLVYLINAYTLTYTHIHTQFYQCHTPSTEIQCQIDCVFQLIWRCLKDIHSQGQFVVCTKVVELVRARYIQNHRFWMRCHFPQLCFDYSH